MFWGIRKPFTSIRLACCKSFIRVLRFSFFFASFAVHAQVLAAPAPSCASPTALNAASAFSDGGFAYLIPGSFGTADNSSSPTQSTLRVFENGREIAPAHARHADIRAVGRGRFSHWGTNGAGSIRISASDNTDVRRNGKSYSYCMGAATPTPTPGPAPTTAPAPALPPPTLKAYFVAPGGSDSAAGTHAAPFATLQKAHDVAVAGDTIYMRGGTYAISKQITLTRDGASGKRINVFAYQAEKPVLDAASNATPTTWVIRMNNANWWHIRGLELKNNKRGGGIAITGSSSNNIIENNNTHHHGALQTSGGQGISLHGTAGNNQILNNDSHHNRDADHNDADGFKAGSTGAGNVLRGNRSWRNADDGVDMWNGAPVTLANNWAWENGYDDNLKPLGNGNGFKLGGHHTGQISGGHTVVNNVAWKNRTNGLEENNSPGTKPSTVHNNTSWNNGGREFSMDSLTHVMRNNLAYGTVGVANANDAANSWNLVVTVSNADFASLDDTCARGPRQADGSLPDCSFLRLAAGSDLIDKGVNVHLPYSGAAPDLGAGNR